MKIKIKKVFCYLGFISEQCSAKFRVNESWDFSIYSEWNFDDNCIAIEDNFMHLLGITEEEQWIGKTPQIVH